MSEKRFAYCLTAVIGLMCACGARGDVTPVAADPPISSTAQQALNTADLGNELAKVGPEIDKLVQNPGNPGIVNMVRQWLIAQDTSTASNPYQNAYTQALNAACVNALSQPDVPINSKLNMGIVIASLTGPKTNLAPTTLKLLQDSNTMVALQGVKAAGAMLPLSLQDANFNSGLRDSVLGAIVAVVSSHLDGPLAGQIAGEAYRAINPALWAAGAMPTDGPLTALIEANLKLQSSRLQIYQNTGIPPYPKADTFASYLLLSGTTWPVMTPAEQTSSVQQAVNLISFSGQRYSASSQALNANRDLIESLQSQGKWIQVLGGILNDPNISQVGAEVYHLSPATPASTVQTACNQVFGAIQANQAFSAITQPPTVVGGASPPSAGAAPAGTTPGNASNNSTDSSPTSAVQP
jgi:hypothetical protein